MSLNAVVLCSGFEVEATEAFKAVKRAYPDVTSIGTALHITLTRPSTVPAHLQERLHSDLCSLFESSQSFDVYFKDSIDAFITGSGDIAFGIPVVIDTSSVLTSLLDKVNMIVSKYGLLPFHKNPNMHVTFAILPANHADEITSSPEVLGPKGSQFLPAILPFKETYCSCESAEVRVGMTIKTVDFKN